MKRFKGIFVNGKNILSIYLLTLTFVMILLVSGFIKSGKDSVANILTRSKYWKRVGIADALKDDAARTFGINRLLMDTQEGKSFISDGKSVRDILISHARYKKILHGDDFWVEQTAPAIDKHIAAGKSVVISDFRYENEYTFLKKYFENRVPIKTLRIERPGLSILDDASEHQLSYFKFDYKVINDGTLLDLEQKISFLNGIL